MNEENIGNEPDADLVQVELNGKIFMVPAQMADAMKAQNEQFKTELESTKSIYEQQLQGLNENLSSKLNNLNQSDATEVDDFETEFYANPRQALENFGKKIKDEVRAEYLNKTQADEQEKRFWGEFYKENKDLKDHQLIIDGIIQRDRSQFEAMAIPQLKKELADKARQYLLKFSAPSSSEAVHTETPTAGSAGIENAQDKAPQEKILTLSDQIRRRAEQRHKARIKFKQAR